MTRTLIVDTREKPRAIKRTLEYFDRNGIKYERRKLDYGDYMFDDGPKISVDRKQNIAELVRNCSYINKTKGINEPKRFTNEMERAAADGARLVILVEQNRYKDREEWIHVENITDLLRWSSPRTTIRGEAVYRKLSGWTRKYPISVVFCDKRQTGREIIKILSEGKFEPQEGK